MRRRTFVSLTILALAAALVGWLPTAPVVRDWLGSQLVEAAAGVGMALAFDEVTGYAWRGLSLEGPRVVADGLDLTATRVTVVWFLPALVVGELPLRLEVRDLRGDVELGRLDALAESFRRDAAAAPPAVRLRIDGARVDGADLRVAEAPFDLPDLAIERLAATSLEGESWLVAVTLTTDEGRLEGEIRGRFGATDLHLTLLRGDARVARHWWDGIEGGLLAGELRLDAAGPDGAFELRAGALEAYGVPVTEVAGPIAWRGDRIEAAWTGTALGGRIEGAGSVDVGAATWRAEGVVEARLEDATVELLRLLEAGGLPPADHGVVRGRVVADGWNAVSLEADLALEGAWLGAPLDVPDLRLGFVTDVGLSLGVDGRWGEGPLKLRTEATAVPQRWSLEAGPVDLFGVRVAELAADWTTGAGPVSGRARLLAGDGPWRVAADVSLDAEGLQAFLTGDLYEEPFEGALASPTPTAGAPLAGGITWRPPAAWASGDPEVTAEFTGSLAEPRARVSVGGSSPVVPRIAAPGLVTELLPDLDLRGAVDAAWGRDGIGVAGRLGPVELAGNGDRWRLSLPRLPLGGALVGAFGPATLDWGPQAWAAELEVDLATQARVPGLDAAWLALAEPLSLRAEGEADGWVVRSADGAWRATSADGRFSVADATVWLAGRPAVLTADGGLEAGTARATWTGAQATASWDGTGIAGELRTGDRLLAWRWALDGEARVDGELDLGVVSAGLAELRGGATVSAGWRPDREALPVGQATVILGEPWPVDADLVADGERIAWQARSALAGQPVHSQGAWRPGGDPALEGTLAWAEFEPLEITSDGVRGEGTWPGWGVADVAVPPQRWRLDATPDGQVELAVGDSRAVFSLSESRLDARIDLALVWGDGLARAHGDARWSADDPDGRLRLALVLPDGGGADVTGDLRGLDAELRGPVAAWAVGATPVLGESGEAALAGELGGLARWRPDGAPTLELNWRDRAGRLVTLSATERALDVVGDGWALGLENGDLITIQAADVDLAPLLRRDDLTLRIDGGLRLPLSEPGASDGLLTGRVGLDGLVGDVRVIGEDGLQLMATGRAGPVDVSLGGPVTLHPTPSWLGDWRVTSEDPVGLAGHGTFVAEEGDLLAAGVVRLPAGELGPLSWPALGLQVEFGPHGAVTAAGRDGLAGAWPTGLSTDVVVAGSPARLTVRDGDGGWTAELDGPRFDARWTGDLEAWRLVAGAREGDREVRLEVAGSADAATGTWSARDLPVTGDTAPLPWAGGEVDWRGASLVATLPASALDLGRALRLSAVDEVALGGGLEARLDADGWSLDGHIEATAAPQADVAARLDVVAVGRSLTIAWDVRAGAVASSGSARSDDLGGLPVSRWQIEARAADVPFSGRLETHASGIELRLEDAAGAWHAVAEGGAQGRAELLGPADTTVSLVWSSDPAWVVEVDAAAAGFLAAARIAAEPSAAVDEGGPWLRLDAWHETEPWRAHLVGPLAPLELRGSLAVTDVAFPAELVAEPAWRLHWGDLSASWRDGAVVLVGRTEVGQLPLVELHADGLAWHPTDGWAGAGRLAGGWPEADLEGEATLRGHGDLEAELNLRWAGQAVGGARLRLGADVVSGVRGEADLGLPFGADDAWRLSATGPVVAEATGWRADLALVLDGPLPATGQLTAADGGAEARLTGTGVEVRASLQDGVADARVRADNLPLDAWLPWVTDPRVSGSAAAMSGPEGWSWRVDALRLELPSGQLEGVGVGGPNGRVTASARVDLDLADLRLDEVWRGRIQGPVSFDGTLDDPLAGQIAARLDARDVTFGDLAATWRGDIGVTGSAGDPTLRATWVARGDAAQLDGEASWQPAAERLRVIADGRIGEAQVQLDVSLTPEGFAGDGTVGWQDAVWLVAGDEGRLRVAGTEAWSGWRATIDPGAWRVDLRGDLSVVPEGRGELVGSVGLAPPERPVVDIAFRNAGAAGFELGSGAVTGDAATGWRLVGEHLLGELAPDLASWHLEARRLTTPIGDTQLDLRATGEAEAFTLSGHWRGDSPTGPIDLRAALERRHDRWSGVLQGDALGGRVHLPVALADGRWQGAGELRDAEFAGLPLHATLDLDGSLAAPELGMRLTAGPEGGWQADLSWSDGAGWVSVVVPLPDGGRLSARGRAFPDLDLVIDAGDDDRVRLRAGWTDGPLTIDGALDVGLGPVGVMLAGPATVQLHLPALDGGLRAALPGLPLLSAFEELRRDGWRWVGVDGWTGTVHVARAGGPLAEVDDLRFAWQGVQVQLSGAVDGPDAADLQATLDLHALRDVLAAAGTWPWSEPAVLALRWDGSGLDLRASAPWTLVGRVDPGARTAAISLDVRGTGPAATAPTLAGELTLDDAGWAGELRLTTVTDVLGDDPASLEATVRGEGPVLGLSAALRGVRGSATASGRWDAAELRPAGWGQPASARVREADARVVAVDLAGFGGARALSGTVSGSISWRGEQVFGRLASDALTLGGRTEPAHVELLADLRGADGPLASARLDLGGADALVEVDALGVSAFVRMERFPLHELVAAAIGPSDVVAEVTGAVRAAWGWDDRVPRDLRVASERVVLERAGVVTRGEFALDWDGHTVTIGRAAFEGRGSWQARGTAGPDLLDLELLAQAADFGPLLGLLPAFAGYGVTAEGDLVLTARGTPASPDVVLRTDDLAVGVGGTRYRLEGVRFTLQGESWSGRADIAGVAPLTGRLSLVTDGRVGAADSDGFALAARAVGEIDVPFVGRLEEVVADLNWHAGAAPSLRVAGRLGAPFTIAGGLAPLDLRATGRGLSLGVPFLAVTDAIVDADLRVIGDAEGVRVSGRVDAAQARVDLAARAAFAAASVSDAPAPPAPPPSLDPRTRVRFDGVRLVAPQRVSFAESFGNAEASVDLTLDGTAAEPRLSGTIRALRGTVRFAGRDLELTEAVAAFDPTRGVYPNVRLAGRASFEKARALPPSDTVRFVAPAGPRFSVDLLLEGEALVGPRGFALDLTPTLSSDALVEGLGRAEPGGATGAGARPLTELELLSLLTLGRLEVTGGVAGAVAQSAIDAAVDLLFTGELQAALAEALGVDVVELRTTTVSTLLDGGDPFGVSLRLGGYLTEEVFASYRVSTLAGDAFSNEVALAYQLGPVTMDVTGRIDVAAGSVAASTPSLAIGARYGFAPGLSLELGLDLSTQRSTARLGVTWRW